MVDPGTSFAPYPLADQQLMLNATVDLTPPSLSGLSAASGSTAGGESIVISGQHLANATQVLFGSAPGTITTNSNTQVTVTVPAQAATTVDVTVTTAGGSTPITTAGRYAFVSPPASAGTGSPSPSPGSGSADITAPAISAFVVSPTTFMAANSGPSAVEAAAVGGGPRDVVRPLSPC